MTRTRSGHDGGQAPRRPRMSSSASRDRGTPSLPVADREPFRERERDELGVDPASDLVPGHVGREDGLGEPRVREATDQGENDREVVHRSSIGLGVAGTTCSEPNREETGPRLARRVPARLSTRCSMRIAFHKGQRRSSRWPLSARQVHGPCVRWWGSSRWPCGARPPARPSSSGTTSPASPPAGSPGRSASSTPRSRNTTTCRTAGCRSGRGPTRSATSTPGPSARRTAGPTWSSTRSTTRRG